MATTNTTYGVNHRRQQSLLLALSSFALLLSVVPRQERALFAVTGRPLKAFGVTVPPVSLDDIAYSYAPRGPFTPRAFFARQPNDTGAVGTPGAVGPGAVGPAAPFAPAGATGAGPDGASTPGGSPVTSSAGPAAPGTSGGVPFFPTTLTPPTSDPVGTTQTAAVTPVTVVPGVPEPATWLLMIAGFGLIGGMLRFRSTRSRAQSNAI